MWDWDNNSSVKLLLWLVFLSVACFLLHLPSELAVSLAIPPDSNEYAIGLANLFEHGVFGFTLNGEWYPSRYAPWFSLFCLSPAYFMFGGNVLALHWAILAFALVFLVISYKIARLAGLGKWSFLCAVLPLFIPDFVFYSRMVMTEIPYTALFAASALVFVRFAEAETLSVKFCLGAGAIVAWAGMARATALPMLALFGVAVLLKRCEVKKKVLSILMLSAPAAVYESVALAYNWRVFGSPFRSGYNFWVPVPCDFLELTFGLDLAVRNIKIYFAEPLFLIGVTLALFVVVVALLIVKGFFGGCRKNKCYLILSGYVIFQGFVLFSLYIGYYFHDERFFLPVVLCILPIALAAVARIASGLGETLVCVAVLGVVLDCVFSFRLLQPRYSYMIVGYPLRIAEAEMTSAAMPPGAMVLIWGNPCLLDHFGFRKMHLECFPINRDFDYVRYMYAPDSISRFEPRPKARTQRIVPEIVASGACILPFPETFEENPERIKEYLKAGRRVFLHRGVTRNPNTLGARRIFETLDRMGLEVKEYGVWAVPEITANPVRRLYDGFVFPRFRMDTRPEVKSVYYEILLKGGT